MFRQTTRATLRTLLISFALLSVSLQQGTSQAAEKPEKAPPADAIAPLADRVPEDAIAYFGWRGTTGLTGQFKGTRLKTVVDATNINELADPFFPQLIERIDTENKDAGAIAHMVLAIAGPMWKHPSAFYFSGIDYKKHNEATPRLALICRAGKEAADLEKELNSAMGRAEEAAGRQLGDGAKPPMPLRVERKGDTVAIVAGDYQYSRPKATESLAASADFQAAMSKVGKDPAIAGYLNFDRLMKLGDDALDRFGDAEGKEAWPKLRATLGLEGLHSAVLTCGFDGKDWSEQCFIAAPEPRRGLLALPDDQPVSKEALAMIPMSATIAGVAHVDLSKVLGVSRKSADEFKPGTSDAINGALQQISQMTGVDVENDLFGGLGNEWVCYSDPMTGGRGLGGGVVVNRLRNAEKAERALTGIEKFIGSVADQMLKAQKIHLVFQTTQSGDVTIHYLATPLYTPAWSIHGGNLYVALFPQVTAAAAEHVAAKGKSILDNPDFVAFQKEIGIEQPASIEFVDLRRTAPDSYNQWLMISHLSGIADIFGVKSPAMLVPPLNKLLPQLTAAGEVTWADKDGFHSKGTSPFPGSTLLATSPFDSLTSANPMLISILLPALNKARERAAEVKSASNLKQIGVGALIYSNDHKGQLPKSLGELATEADVAPSVFCSPRRGSVQPPALATPEVRVEWVNAHSDYVWTGAGLTNAAGSEVVLAYENPQGLESGTSVPFLFADGHVESLSLAAAQEKIANMTKPANR